MIKERLKDLDIKITELANYLNISRPTMYKFIDCYDSGLYKEISPGVKKLFDYIDKNDLIGKNNVISYILSKPIDKNNGNGDDGVREVSDFVKNNPDSEKTHLIQNIIKNSKYDIGVHFLSQVVPLLKKKNVTQEEQKLIDIYNEIIDLYS